MPHLLSVGTAVPKHIVAQEASMAVSRRLFADAFSDIDRLLAVFGNSGIRKRHFAAPLEWFGQSHSFAEKNRLFIEAACTLGGEAILRALAACSLKPEAVDCLIVNTSSGLSTPSLDARLVNQLGFRQDVTRIPLWGLGCAGGATGLSRAFEFAAAYPESVVLLLCVELCGLTFNKEDLSKSNLIATSLFADGAAAVLIAGDVYARKHGWAATPRFRARKSFTWHDSLDVMGWDITESGLKVVFSQDIPSLVRHRVRDQVDNFLADHRLSRDRIDHYVLHPGGPKVIRAYEQALELDNRATRLAEEVLADYGNMSSPTVLFVLQRSLAQHWKRQEIGLISALGPGFSSELILLEQGG